MSALHHIALAFAALFLLMQGLSAAHMAEFGGDHDHDGVACSVAVYADDQADLALPALETPVIWAQPPELPRSFALSPAPTLAPTSRAPPPRGPPA